MLAFTRFALASSLVASFVSAAEFTVKVGANGLKFEPNQITANAGDIITFEFHPKNHTLTQSSLANPCTTIPNGGDSGFIPVAATATAFPTKRLVVPDSTTPLWFYCAQGNHCNQGMVFAVNPGTPEKMETFLANAAADVPGGAPPPANIPPASTPPANTPPANTPPASTPAPVPAPGPSDAGTTTSTVPPPAITPGGDDDTGDNTQPPAPDSGARARLAGGFSGLCIAALVAAVLL